MSDTPKSDAEFAAEIKTKIEFIMREQLSPLFAEATRRGMTITWDGISSAPPFIEWRMNDVRLLKRY